MKMKFCPSCESRYDDQTSFCPQDGKALVADIIGLTINEKYKIEKLIGYGGMGTVFLAKHLQLHGDVAIKVLPSSANAEWRRRFEREGRAIMRLNGHPNIVFIRDLISNGDLIYMVQEFIAGHNLGTELKDRLEQGRRFIPAEALKVLEPVANALDKAHSEGIVHRDVKPENIMVMRLESLEPKVKLMDFGVAKILNSTDDEDLRLTALTPTNRRIGTYYYMSPEQWGVTPRDQEVEIDRRADIFSLGVIAYQMVSGNRPFEAQTPRELYDKICSIIPTPLHEILANVPEGFSNAVSRAMGKDRADRQGSASEFINELRASLGQSSALDIGRLAETVKENVIQHSLDDAFIDLAIEMSDRLTVVYRRDIGVVISEPSKIVINTLNNTVKAVGTEIEEVSRDEADELYRPIKGSKVADRELARKMLRRFVQKACGGNIPANSRIIIATPLELTGDERRAFQDMIRRAEITEGRELYYANRVLCAAIGAGVPVKQHRGTMIVHISDSVTEIATISHSRIQDSSHVQVGSDEMNEAVRMYIKRKYNLDISESWAELVRSKLGSCFPLDEPLSMEVRGRNLLEGLPKTITVTDEEVREALADSVEAIISAIRAALQNAPPELSADIIDEGITLTGSGAAMKGWDQRLWVETLLPIKVAEDPVNAVVIGACSLLTDSSQGVKEPVPNLKLHDFVKYRSKLTSTIRGITSLLSSDLAIDCGEWKTLLYAKGRGIVVSEPSVIAINKVTNVVEAVGRDAREMIGRTQENTVIFHPIKNGVIVDSEIAGLMIDHFVRKAHNNKLWPTPRVVMPIRSWLSKVERQAFIDTAYRAHASEVYFVEEMIAAAIGADLPISEPRGFMIVDIGGGTTDIAVISLSEIVYSRSLRVAGSEMNEAIRQYIKRKYNLLIGERTAESVKIELGSAFPLDDEPLVMEVLGRNLNEGIPKAITITDEEVREALSDSIASIVNAVRVALERTPPELAADIVQTGITLTGGSSNLKAMDKRISIETGLPVSIADDPLSCVILGAGKMLRNLSLRDRNSSMTPKKASFDT